jgi:hypothetical protein
MKAVDFNNFNRGEGRGKSICCTLFTAVLVITQSCTQAGTIATFADPAISVATPLFTVDVANSVVRGGWSGTGLNLDSVANNKIFVNSFFTMTDLTYTGSLSGGSAGPGTIKFFAHGDDPASAAAIFQIDFTTVQVSLGGLSANNIFSSNGVTYSGSELSGKPVTDGSFSFAFANLAALPNNAGYTATAAFTSSEAPEPASIVLLGTGFILLKRR